MKDSRLLFFLYFQRFEQSIKMQQLVLKYALKIKLLKGSYQKQERLKMIMKACAVLDKIEICIISNFKNNVISFVTNIQYMTTDLMYQKTN